MKFDPNGSAPPGSSKDGIFNFKGKTTTSVQETVITQQTALRQERDGWKREECSVQV